MRKCTVLRSILAVCAAALALAGCGSGSGTTYPVISTSKSTGSWADVRVASGNQSVTISWEDKSSTKASATYNIYFSTSPGVQKDKAGVTKIADVTSPYIHTGLDNGRPYYYVVTKVSALGKEGAESYEAAAVPQPALPAATTGITIKAEDSQITLTLERPGTEPSNIKYNLYWTTDTTLLATPAKWNNLPNAYPTVNGAKTTSYTMNALDNGTTYYFCVTADTGNGEGPFSKTLSAVPRKKVLSIAFVNMTTQAKMAAPYAVTAQNGNQKAYLTWNAVTPPAKYAADDTTIVPAQTNKTMTYTIYWSNSRINSLSGLNKITITGVDSSGNLRTGTLNYTHPGLTNGLTYYYVITASTTAMEGVDQPVAPTTVFESYLNDCTQVSVVPEALYPAVPSGLAAATGNQQVSLSWNRDKTGATVSYNLYWTTSSSGTWSKISGLTSNSYVHSGLTTGTTYYYKVTAVIDGESDYSAVVSATP
jgi:fibronectin type 3 domain-containing protein